MKTIADLQDPKYKLVTDYQAVASLADGLGFDLDGSHCLFICEDPQGDYISEVWGFTGCIPLLTKPVKSLLSE